MVQLSRLILRAILSIAPLTLSAGGAFALLWFILARHGVVADVRDIRLFLIGELLFLLLATYVMETAARSHPDRREDQPPVLETLAIAVGALPLLFQNTLAAALFLDWEHAIQLDWKPLETRFQDIPNLFAALIWGVFSLRASPWYVLALIVVLCVAVYVSVRAARAANFAHDGKPIKSTLSLYVLAVGLYTLNGLFIRPHMTIGAVESLASISLNEKLLVLLAVCVVVASCAATAWGFRRATAIARSVDGRLIFLVAYALFVACAAAGSLWLAWLVAEKIPSLAAISRQAGTSTVQSLSFDWRPPTFSLLAIFLLMLAGALWRKDAWAVIGRVLHRSICDTARAFWSWTKSLWRGAVRRRVALALCTALLLAGSSAKHHLVLAAPSAGQGVHGGSQEQPPAPQVFFRQTEVVCRNASWMVRQTDRATVPLEMCFPLEDADYFIAIGDATSRGGPTTEEPRALERARALAEAVEAQHPALHGHVFAFNAGITSQGSNRFEANQIRAIIGTLPFSGAQLSDGEFVEQLRSYLRLTGIGPHTVCRLYRFNSTNAPARLTEIDNISCKLG